MIGKGRFLFGIKPEILVVENIGLARHQINATRGAQRRRVTIFETDPRLGQCVESRRRVLFAPITAETFETNIVSHDQQNVHRFIGCGDENRGNG